MSVCVLGSINLDIVCRVAALPRPGETVAARSMSHYAGGKGANQAIASARWGAPTAMIGALGRDDAGAMLLAQLGAAGVGLKAVALHPDAPTGRAHINVSDAGENQIVVVGGANLEVSAASVGAVDLAPFQVVLAQLETPLEAIEALFAAAKAIRILNAAPAVAEAAILFPFADVLVVNETELASYAGMTELAEMADEVDHAARMLISRAGQSVVVTLGAAGARIVTADKASAVRGLAARVVDTTGAGDCFCGVLAASLSEGAALDQAVALANAAAAVSTETPGASAPADLRERIGSRMPPPIPRHSRA